MRTLWLVLASVTRWQLLRTIRNSFNNVILGLSMLCSFTQENICKKWLYFERCIVYFDISFISFMTAEIYLENGVESSHRLAKLPTLMPDLMESSETEDNDDDTVSESDQNSEQVFPSLPDCILKKLNVHKDKVSSNEKLTEKDIENKFTTLSLAFKTDKFTLGTRLELLQRHRNTAEENIESELQDLRDAVNMLNHFIPDPRTRDLFTNIQQHIDVIQQSINRLSGRAEMYGAAQQEERLSHAAEIMVAHVENLKRLREKEHGELEDTRRLLLETRLLSGEKRDDIAMSKSPLLDCTGMPKSATMTRRRASVAGYQRPLLSDLKSTGNNWLVLTNSKTGEVKRSLGSFSIISPGSNNNQEITPVITARKSSTPDSSNNSISEESITKTEEQIQEQTNT